MIYAPQPIEENDEYSYWFMSACYLMEDFTALCKEAMRLTNSIYDYDTNDIKIYVD